VRTEVIIVVDISELSRFISRIRHALKIARRACGSLGDNSYSVSFPVKHTVNNWTLPVLLASA
jgi:hypothetical protein